MTITLLPHQEKIIEAAISAGVIRSVEEFVDSAVAHLPPLESINSRAGEAKDVVELFAPLRGLNIDFERDRDPGRDIDL